MVRDRVFELTLHTLYAHLAQAVHNAHAECAVTEKATGKMTGMMTGFRTWRSGATRELMSSGRCDTHSFPSCSFARQPQPEKYAALI